MIPRRRRTPFLLLLAAAFCLAGPRSTAKVSGARTAEVGAGPVAPSDPVVRGLAEGRLLFDAGRYHEAYSRCRALLRTSEESTGPDSLPTAHVLDLLLLTQFYDGDTPDKAEFRGKGYRALRIKERLLPADDPDIADTLAGLGDVLRETGGYTEAESRFQRALEIRERTFGPDSAEVAQILVRMGRLYDVTGLYAKSLELFERALAIQERTLKPDDPALGYTLCQRARLYWDSGDYQASRESASRSLEILVKSLGPEHPEVATSLSALSLSLWSLGDLGGALETGERALAIRLKMGPDFPNLGTSLLNLGLLSEDLGDFETARVRMEKAFALGRAHLPPDHPSASRADNNLGELLLRQGDPAGAKPYLERAIGIKERLQGPEHPLLISSLTLLAQACRETGETTRAEALLERAERIARKAYGERHPQIAGILVQRADLDLARERYREAESLARKALDLQRALLGPEHPDSALSLDLLARAAWWTGRPGEAVARSLQAASLIRRHLRRTARVLSEREALRYETTRSSSLDVALSALGDGIALKDRGRLAEEIFDEVIRSRALVLDEMASRHRSILQNQDPEALPAVRSLEEARSRLAGLVTRGPGQIPPEEYLGEVEKARGDEERAERNLARASLSFRAGLRQGSAGLAEIRRGLPAGASLLSYARFRRLDPPSTRNPGGRMPDSAGSPIFYLAFVLDRGAGRLRVIPLEAASTIDALVREWGDAAGSPPQDEAAARRFLTAGESLRQAVWDPVSRSLGNPRMVLVVPDGALGLASLATLPAGGDRYLVETGPLIHYLSAERDVVPEEVPSEVGKGLLAVGGVDFDAGKPSPGAKGEPKAAGAALLATLRRGSRAACGGFRSLRFEPLPGSLAEVRDLGKLWNSGAGEAERGEAARILTGTEAREAELKRLAPGHRIVHLATHGFLLDGECESDLALARSAPGPDLLAGLDSQRGENPLLLTGLALAGANAREDPESALDGEDGILTGEEIASLDLRGVQWAVLSACETGRGPVQSGEGILGLRRAFQVAGARTLIMSLWGVGDQAAWEWTRLLYQNRLAGLPTAEAVRTASLDMIRSRRKAGVTTHPFPWGAFIAVGDWR